MLGTQRNPTAISTFAKLEIVVERPLRKGIEFAALEAPHELQQHKTQGLLTGARHRRDTPGIKMLRGVTLLFCATATHGLLAPRRSFPVARRPQRAPTCRMLFDKFDAEAVNVLMYAQQETRSAKLGEVGTEQVLLGVLQCPENAKKALDRFGVTLDAMRDTIGVKKSLGDKAAELFRREEEPLPFTARSKACFKRAVSESEAMACEEVRPEHLFLAVARDEQSEARAALEKLGIEVDALCDAVAKDARKAKGSLVGVGGDGDERETTLASVGVDLTALALDGELDPCVGRTEEIARAVQILLRRRKSNPCLVGDAGVGKTAIAEGLERRP